MVPSLYVIVIILTHLSLVRGDFFHAFFKNVVFENAYQLNVSETCSEQLQIFVSSLQGVDANSMWAWKMVDATAKLQSGILEGNVGNLGHFDECVDTSANTSVGEINGRYCLGRLSFKSRGSLQNFVEQQMEIMKMQVDVLQENVGRSGITSANGFQWGGCFPDGCSGEEMEKVYNYISQEYLNGTLVFSFSEDLCQTKEDTQPPLTSEAIVAITIFSIILTCVILSTIYDLYLQHTNSRPAHLVLVAFSAYTNSSKLFAMAPNNPDMMPCLNGLRVISMMWVVVGHQYASLHELFFNPYDIIKWFDKWYSMYIRGATVSVDTFFVLSGLLMTYGFMKAKAKGIPFNIFLYWLHRYLRLTPTFAATILFQTTLTKYLGDGPMWPPNVESFTKNCEEYWWSALLYIQNYVNVTEMCLGQSWYLSVDMQLFILSPLILLPLWRWKNKGLMLLFLLTLVSVIVPFVIAWEYNLVSTYVNPSIVLTGNNDYSTKYYYVTHTRATPWLIGVLLGYTIFVIKKRNNKLKLNKYLVLLSWAATLVVLVTCVFGGHDTLMTEEYDKWANVSYVVFVRPAWAIALSWLIFACVTGNGGCINWFLSFPIYQVLARLTYSVYLLHMLVIFVKSTTIRLPEYFSDYDRMYSFWGTTIFTCALSILWVLAFESPMITIEKVLFGRAGKPKVQPKPKEETVKETQEEKC